MPQNLFTLSVSIKQGQSTVVKQVEGRECVSCMESLGHTGIFSLKKEQLTSWSLKPVNGMERVSGERFLLCLLVQEGSLSKAAVKGRVLKKREISSMRTCSQDVELFAVGCCWC